MSETEFTVVDVYLEDSAGRRRTAISRPKLWQLWEWPRWLQGETVMLLGKPMRVEKLGEQELRQDTGESGEQERRA